MASPTSATSRASIYTLEDRIYACLLEQPLEPGEVRLVVSRDQPQAIGVGPIGDFAGYAGWPQPRDRRPGPRQRRDRLHRDRSGRCPRSSSCATGPWCPAPSELRTWVVAIPRSADLLWWVQAVMRGPDLPSLERPRSMRSFGRCASTTSRPRLTRRSRRRVGTAIDSVDRSMRQYPGRRFLDCMPRTPGTVDGDHRRRPPRPPDRAPGRHAARRP